jgi:hypothetical protein
VSSGERTANGHGKETAQDEAFGAGQTGCAEDFAIIA